MAQLAVIQAVQSTLTQWTLTPVVGLNEETDDAVLGRFVEAHFPISRAKRVSVGTRAYREEGMLRLLLAMERGVGITRPADYAGQLAALFNDKTIDGVVFKTAHSPQFDETNDEGSYFVVNILVPYTYEYEG